MTTRYFLHQHQQRWLDLPLRAKGLSFMFIPLVMLLVISLTGITLNRQAAKQQTHVATLQHLHTVSQNLSNALLNAEITAQRYQRTQQLSSLTLYNHHIINAQQQAQEFETLASTLQTLPPEFLNEFRHDFQEALTHLSYLLHTPATQVSFTDSASLLSTHEHIAKLLNHTNALLSTSLDIQAAASTRNSIIMIASTTIAVLLAILAFSRLIAWIITRIELAEANAERLAKLAPLEFAPVSNDELGRLNQALRVSGDLLKRQSEQLEAALESGRVLIFDLNTACQDVRIQGALAGSDSRFAFSPDVSVSLDDWLARIHEDDRVMVREAFVRLQTHAEFHELNYRLQHEDTMRWLIMRGKVVRKNGNVGLVGVMIDNTEQKLAEAAQQSTESNYQLVVENLKEVVFKTSTTGEWLFLNHAWEEITGFSTQESLGKHFAEFIHPDDLEEGQQNFMALMSLQSSRISVDLRFKSAQGVYVWLEVNGHIQRDTAGRITGITGTLLDISWQKEAQLALTAQKEFYENMLNVVPVEMIVLDRDLRFQFCNPAAISSPEIREWIMGKTDVDFCEYRGYDRALGHKRQQHCKQAIAQRRTITWQETITKPDRTYHMSRNITPIFDAQGELEFLIGYSFDLSERINAENKIIESEQKLRAIVDASMDAISLTDADGKYLLVNPAGAQLFGQPSETLVGKDSYYYNAITSLNLAEVDAEVMQNHSAGRYEYTLQTPEGDLRVLSSSKAPYTNAQGEVAGVVSITRDITEQKQIEQALKTARDELELRVQERTVALQRLNERLQHDAFHDALTGMPNRALFLDRLGHAIERKLHGGSSGFAVLFLDFDRFKVVNDSLGHSVGDSLLAELGQVIMRCLRPSDTAARLGGDEFTIMLDDVTSHEDALVVAQRIHAAFSQPVKVDGHLIHTSASIGIVNHDEHYEEAADVLRDADIAMYRAKAKGSGQTVVFNTSMRDRAIASMKLEADLRNAIQDNALSIFYQPIVHAETSQMAGLEALVRWEHPVHGFLMPETFIPIVEETGMIVELDRLVLTQACQQLAHWQHMHPTMPSLTLSVNLSTQQFRQSDLVSFVKNILCDTGLKAPQLKLEITESLLIDTTVQVQEALEALRQLGVQLHIDDFGTGYSSLSYLQRFSANTLKVDRSFIRNLHESADSAELVKTIVSMAHNLGMQVVAEGVESSEQLNKLRALGCEFIQGYLFARPMPSEHISELLRRHDWLLLRAS